LWRRLRPADGLLLAPGHRERFGEPSDVVQQVAQGVPSAGSRVAELVVAHPVHESGHLAGGGFEAREQLLRLVEHNEIRQSLRLCVRQRQAAGWRADLDAPSRRTC